MKILRKLKKRLIRLGLIAPKSKMYQIGEVVIQLSPDHPLPAYQHAHPFYDRFIPHLCARLKPADVIIDVGANIGDTAAAIVSANPELRVLSIEADDSFYKLLNENSARIRAKFPRSKLECVRALVGEKASQMSLVGSAGTKKAVQGGNLDSKSLDRILDEQGIETIRLLKSDVDGHDHDVIRSAEECLTSDPIIYFECQFDTSAQYDQFMDLFEWLSSKGYAKFYLFDNFGQLLYVADDIKACRPLFEYVAKQNFETKHTRTLHYYDILTCKDSDIAFLDDVVADYV